MKKRIQRTLFWFRDGEYGVDELGNQFFPLATLLNNLINEKYEGRKLQFINFNFSTEATYQLYPAMPRDSFYWGGGKDINFDAWIDLDEFSKKDRKSQELFLWEKSRVFFEQIAKTTQNESLLKASQYAYHKGLEKELNPNFKFITKTIEICNISVVASLWIRFTADKMKSYFTLEKDGKAIYEEFLHRSDLGFEIFLDMYKDIIVKDNTIIITGFTDIDYFPVKIAIDEHMLNGIEE